MYTLLQKKCTLTSSSSPRWPQVTDPNPGSCQVCQIVLGVHMGSFGSYSQDHLKKLKWPEVGVVDLGTSVVDLGTWYDSCVQNNRRRVYMCTASPLSGRFHKSKKSIVFGACFLSRPPSTMALWPLTFKRHFAFMSPQSARDKGS